MRKLIALIMVTLDDYYDGPETDCGWRVMDGDHLDFLLDPKNALDTVLFARITYQLAAKYWLRADLNLKTTQEMNELYKIIFSTTLQQPIWKNTT